jgi:hypothetical protein
MNKFVQKSCDFAVYVKLKTAWLMAVTTLLPAVLSYLI